MIREEILKIIEEFKTIQMVKKENSKFISSEAYHCKLNNGRTITREKILKNGNDGSAVIIFPITHDGKVILAIEPRVFTKRTVDIGLPAGYIENGEKPSIAAKRELKEETGYITDSLIPLGCFYQDQGCSSALNHYYLALNCKKVSKQHLDKDEFIKYILVNFDELDELLENNMIMGLNSAYAIEKGKSYVKEMKVCLMKKE